MEKKKQLYQESNEINEIKEENEENELSSEEKLPEQVLNGINNKDDTNDNNIDNNYPLSQKQFQINQNPSNKSLKNELIQLELLNFIELFIHNILYLRQVYPKQSFYSYSIYSLDFLHYMPDPEIAEYISSFLSSIESLFLTKSIKAIYIMILDSSINKVIELFAIDIIFSELWLDLSYEELCLQLKTIFSNFYYHYCNKPVTVNMNKTFDLGIETKDPSIIKGKKVYDDITNTIQNKYIHNIIMNELIDVFQNKSVVASIDEGSLHIEISHSHIQ